MKLLHKLCLFMGCHLSRFVGGHLHGFILIQEKTGWFHFLVNVFDDVTNFNVVSLGDRVRILVDEIKEFMKLIHDYILITYVRCYLGS
jgi:hypothetical protein